MGHKVPEGHWCMPGRSDGQCNHPASQRRCWREPRLSRLFDLAVIIIFWEERRMLRNVTVKFGTRRGGEVCNPPHPPAPAREVSNFEREKRNSHSGLDTSLGAFKVLTRLLPSCNDKLDARLKHNIAGGTFDPNSLLHDRAQNLTVMLRDRKTILVRCLHIANVLEHFWRLRFILSAPHQASTRTFVETLDFRSHVVTGASLVHTFVVHLNSEHFTSTRIRQGVCR